MSVNEVQAVALFPLRIKRNIQRLVISIFAPEAVLLGMGHKTCSEVGDPSVLCQQRTVPATPGRPLTAAHTGAENLTVVVSLLPFRLEFSLLPLRLF